MSEAHFAVGENFEENFSEIVRGLHSEIQEESTELVSEGDGTLQDSRIPCGRNRKRRPWDKSNHR